MLHIFDFAREMTPLAVTVRMVSAVISMISPRRWIGSLLNTEDLELIA